MTPSVRALPQRLDCHRSEAGKQRLGVAPGRGELLAQRLERVQAQLPEALAGVQYPSSYQSGSTSPESAVISVSVHGVGSASADWAMTALDQLRAWR